MKKELNNENSENMNSIKIAENNKLLAKALEVAANGIVITDEKGVIVWANSAINELTGFEPYELLGENPKILKSGIHDDSFYKNMWDTISSGKVFHCEIVNRRKNGSFYFEEQSITPIKDSAGIITNYISIKQDITHKRFALNQNRRNEMSMKMIMSSIPAFIWLVDSNLMIVSAFGTKIQGFSENFQDFIGSTLNEIFGEHSANFPPLKDHYKALKGQSVKTEYNFQGVTVQCFIDPYRDLSDNIQGCVGIAYDITQRKQYESELIKAKRKAEKSEKIKSEFLSQMSHEIRTPLNVIVNFLDLLEEDLRGNIDDDLLEGVAMMKSSSNRITRTINLLLNMSEIQSGTYEYNEEEFDIFDELILPCYKEYEFDAEEKKIDFSILKDTVNTIVKADKYSIDEIIRNLVDNAIKYTKENGKVNITAVSYDDKLIISINDTGIGISDEYKSQLFEIFTQEYQGYTRRYEGNGLGMALVKKYCDLNGLRITFESEKNKGSDFRIIFPSERVVHKEI